MFFFSGISSADSQEKTDSVNNSGTSGDSATTVIFNPHGGIGNISSHTSVGSTNSYGGVGSISSHGTDKPMVNGQISPMHTWNPVLERLTGNNKFTQQLRNESYYKVIIIIFS